MPFRTVLGKVPAELDGATPATPVGHRRQPAEGRQAGRRFDQAERGIASDLPGVANLVAAYGSGFKDRSRRTGRHGGLISARSDGLSASIKSLGKQSEVISARLTQIEARYRTQFTSLDVLLTGMSTTSDYLTQQLANLPTYNN
jgi:hypothetical protein